MSLCGADASSAPPSEARGVELDMNRKPKFAGLGIALGAGLGAVAGAIAGNMGVWLAIGVAIGLLIGISARRKPTECPQCEALHRTHDVSNSANTQVS